MTKQTAQAVERIKRSLSTLNRIADQTPDHEDARAIYAEADYIAEQIDALELDALPGCDDLPADVAEPIAA